MLTVKARKVGSSLVVTVPAHIAEAYDFHDGDLLDFKISNDYHGVILSYTKSVKKKEGSR